MTPNCSLFLSQIEVALVTRINDFTHLLTTPFGRDIVNRASNAIDATQGTM
jgi:hypothetical protein